MNLESLVPITNTIAHFSFPAQPLSTGIREMSSILTASAYQKGFVGCFTNSNDQPEWARKFARYRDDIFQHENDTPDLMDQLSKEGITLKSGKGKRGIPLNLARQFDSRCLMGNQNYGNCTACSLGWDVLNMLNAIQIAVKGEAFSFGNPFGTALIYACRGHSGQGMALSDAANAASKYGVSRRQTYCDGKYDFRDEDADESFGNRNGRSGPPSDLIEETQQDGKVIKVGSLGTMTKEKLRDLLYSHVMIHHGGTLTGTRTGDPICKLTGVGGHAQTTLSFDDTDECKSRLRLRNDEYVVFNQNSWGNYYNISNWIPEMWGPYVPGTWPILASDAVRICNQGQYGCYGYYTLEGLAPLDLDWKVIIP